MSSGSVSVSDECCIPSTCACDDWLTEFCDYEAVTVDYCGVETEFSLARPKGIRMSSAGTLPSGVHPSDKVFQISYQENDAEIGLEAVITDADGVEWVVYSVDIVRAFCIRKLWARSVASCFGLSDKIDVLDLVLEEEDCGTSSKYKLLKRIDGKIIAETGSRRSQGDSSDLVYRFSCDLVRWPLSVRPKASHRLKTKDGVFRIIGVRDGGVSVPYHLDLEIESGDCSQV